MNRKTKALIAFCLPAFLSSVGYTIFKDPSGFYGGLAVAFIAIGVMIRAA